MKHTLILLGFTAYTMAAPTLKRQLAQTTLDGNGVSYVPQGDEGEESGLVGSALPPMAFTSSVPSLPSGEGILDCSCELPSIPGSGFPAPGQGVYSNFGNGAQVTQATSVVTVPDTAYTS